MLKVDNVFTEIALLLGISSLVGALCLKFRQPLIMAFIAVGVIVGPAGLGLLTASHEVELLSELGIALLLFVVGLKLDPHEIRAVGPVAIVTGVGQIILTGLVGYGLGLVLGLEQMAALYVAIALTFSSTIIIVKLLSDKKEIDALHSRIAVGVLIVQDITVVLVMIVITALGGEQLGNAGISQAIILVILKGSAFLLGLGLITYFLLPSILRSLANSLELLVLFGITWALLLASVGDFLGFSKEVGAFLAGVSIATTPYRINIGARLTSLRDFLLLFFFINLGVHIEVTNLGSQILPALIFSLVVLLGKPLLVMFLVGRMGYRKYTGAIASLSLGQISEFSLIIAALGVSMGQIATETQGLITLIGLITMGLSTYMILYSHRIYDQLSPWLQIFERHLVHTEDKMGGNGDAAIDVILFGLGRYGGSMLADLQAYDLKVLGVDFDPELVSYWSTQGIATLYGDAEDPEFPSALPLNTAQWVVSTLPGRAMGLNLLHNLKHHNFTGKIALTSHTLGDKDILTQAGADFVLLPFQDAASEAARIIGVPTSAVTHCGPTSPETSL